MKSILTEINWFALAGGVTTILVIAVSLFYPWWQLTVGDDLLKVMVSPVNMNFGFLDTSLTIPFIWALNIVAILTLLASGIAMLIYSIIPRKSYSEHLLGFGYKKPLFTLLFFVIGLVVTTLILQTALSINVPLMGSTTITLPIPFASDITISVLLSSAFQWSFWLAVVAAALCIAARLYHNKVAPASSTTTVT